MTEHILLGNRLPSTIGDCPKYLVKSKIHTINIFTWCTCICYIIVTPVKQNQLIQIYYIVTSNVITITLLS